MKPHVISLFMNLSTHHSWQESTLKYSSAGRSYNKFKAMTYEWKSRYAKLLRYGDRNFEVGWKLKIRYRYSAYASFLFAHTFNTPKSAWGEGLNVWTTVEILKESSKMWKLEAYGIGSNKLSTLDANTLLPQVLPITGNARFEIWSSYLSRWCNWYDLCSIKFLWHCIYKWVFISDALDIYIYVCVCAYFVSVMGK